MIEHVPVVVDGHSIVADMQYSDTYTPKLSMVSLHHAELCYNIPVREYMPNGSLVMIWVGSIMHDALLHLIRKYHAPPTGRYTIRIYSVGKLTQISQQQSMTVNVIRKIVLKLHQFQLQQPQLPGQLVCRLNSYHSESRVDIRL